MLKVCQTVAQHSHSFFQTMTEKIKIALVDDELLFRKGMELIINQDPELEVVFHAVNGKEFLNAFHNNTLTGVNIVLLDLSMPVMDGIDATKEIRSLGYTLPIVGLTASVRREDFRDLGLDDWIGKPVRLKELTAKIESLVQPPPPPSSPSSLPPPNPPEDG